MTQPKHKSKSNCTIYPRGYFSNSENVENWLRAFIKIENRFPKQLEIPGGLVRVLYQNPEIRKDFLKRHDIPDSTNRSPRGHWGNIENVRNWFFSFIKSEGRFPMIFEIPQQIRKKSDINSIIERVLIESNTVLIPHQRPDGFWEEKFNVQNTLKKVYNEIGRWPNRTELYRLGYTTLSRYWHKIDELWLTEIDYFTTTEKYIANDGHEVISLNELYFDNFLSYNNISHDAEGVIPNQESKSRYDFKITTTNPIYIEVWGYSSESNRNSHKVYTIKKLEKEKLYKSLGLQFIGIKDDVFNLSFVKMYDAFTKSIQEIIPDFVPKPMNLNVFLFGRRRSFEALLDILRPLIIQNEGFMLNRKQLELHGLNNRVYKHGGIGHIAKSLEITKKPRSKIPEMSLSQFKDALTIKYGRDFIPSAEELNENRDGRLQHFISNNGGVKVISSLLDRPTKQEYNSQQHKISLELTAEEFKEKLIAKYDLNFFPSLKKFRQNKDWQLENYVKMNGGVLCISRQLGIPTHREHSKLIFKK